MWDQGPGWCTDELGVENNKSTRTDLSHSVEAFHPTLLLGNGSAQQRGVGGPSGLWD